MSETVRVVLVNDRTDVDNFNLLRARAMDVSLLGNWSEPMPYQIDSVDFDGDGMPDQWELDNGEVVI